MNKEDLLNMVRYGAELVFSSSATTVTDAGEAGEGVRPGVAGGHSRSGHRGGKCSRCYAFGPSDLLSHPLNPHLYPLFSCAPQTWSRLSRRESATPRR